MKLRIRLIQPRRDKVIDLGGDNGSLVLANVVEAVRTEFSLTDFTLSLNGTDPLIGDDRTLSDLGIVGGDLLLVRATDGNASSAATSSSAERIADRVSNVSVSGCNSAVVASSSTVSCRETSTTQLTSSVAKTSSSVEMITDDNVQAVSKVLDPMVNRYLRQPMLVRDSINGFLPESLAITYANVTPRTAHEAVAVVLHVLMTESDFAPLQHKNRYQLPDGWRSASSMKLRYVNVKSGIECVLACVPMGGQLVTHGMVEPRDRDVQPLALTIVCSQYVSQLNSDPSLSYVNLRQLAVTAKDTLVYPLLQLTAGECGLAASLVMLPYDICMRLLKYMDYKQLVTLSLVCKRLHLLCTEPVLWRRLYLLHFGKKLNYDLSQDWLQLFQTEHMRRQEERAAMERARVYVDPLSGMFPSIPPPLFPPSNPHFGIIGGEYDRNPFVPVDPFSHQPGSLGRLPRPRFDPCGPLPHQRLPRPGPGHWGGGGGGFW